MMNSVLEELDVVQLKVKNKLNENFVFIEACMRSIHLRSIDKTKH